MAAEFTGGGDPARSLELLWGTADAPARGPKPGLSPERVVEAAIAHADAEGLAALSMRSVAERLGVGTMSLYTYVPGKAELLDLMLDTVLRELGTPEAEPSGWRAGLEQLARQSFELYRRHPWLLQLAAARPPMGPGVLDKYERELRALEGIGLSDLEMDGVVTLLSGYVHGAARGAADAAQVERTSGITDEQWWAAHQPLLEKIVDLERYPIGSRVGTTAGEEYGAVSDPERAFEFGLARVLDGIEVLVRSKA